VENHGLQSAVAPIINDHAICSKSAARLPSPVVGSGRPASPRRGRVARVHRGFEFLEAPLELPRLDRADEGVDNARNPAASPGVVSPWASAEITAFIAAAMFAGLSIGGSLNLTARSRQTGRRRSTRAARPSDRRRMPPRPPCGSNPPPRPPAASQRRSSPCCASRAGARRHRPTGPSGTAAPVHFLVVLL
jgi:hypothetical protein